MSLLNRLVCGMLSAGLAYWLNGHELAGVVVLSLVGAIAHQLAKATVPPSARPIPPGERAQSAGA